MKKLSADVCAVTHAGRVRKENEDNFSLNGKLTSTGELKKGSAYVQHMKEPFHIAVCDGMGGESFGDIASGIAAEEIARTAADIYESGEDFSFTISGVLGNANDKICDEITARGSRMGTTLAGVYFVKGKAICVSIGDSRIYHYSNGVLQQASFDHTHAQGFVDVMAVSQDDAGQIPDAKRLTKHLGIFPEEAALSPSISVIDNIENGDVILLCSDGLTDMVTDDEISAIVSNGESARDITGKLVKKALERGGKDNITVVTAYMEAEKTAVFKPIAEAMVGDETPDYSEEYRNSFGDNGSAAEDEETVSPYANADANPYKAPVDKIKIMKIAAVAIVVLALLAVAALVFKGIKASKEEETTTVPTTSEEYIITTTEPEISTWNIEDETSETETTEEESSSETTTETTTKYTTRRYTTTTRRTTTTRKVTTTKASTTASTTKTTTTESTATTKQETSSSTETSSSASESSSSSTSATESTTEETTAETTTASASAAQ